MKTAEERLEELESMMAALSVVSMLGLAAAVGDDAEVFIRVQADQNPGLTDPVREILQRLADAVAGKPQQQEASHA
ncbi:hypothetical protein [Achromobacter sp. GD03932]|uniref:hypothetical protein n=1 Tax=Achromobacter sp. GD03932 TaxID=2975407 RepID=UPI002449EA44|nr:hypothetical protein [Achromobacter sp. GD03932]MDH1299702.1 hypothetical protein [Achromobacter sp. GD03932]